MRRPVTVARDETSNERQNGQLPSVTKLEEGADHQEGDCEDKEDGDVTSNSVKKSNKTSKMFQNFSSLFKNIRW